MEAKISIITLGVEDLTTSIKFYQEGLKLPRMDFEGEIAFFSLNGTWLSLYPKDELAKDACVENNGSGFSGITLAHNVTSEALVDTTVDEAIQAGAKLVKKPQKVFWGGYSGYFKDPDEYLWEVAHNPFFMPGPQ